MLVTETSQPVIASVGRALPSHRYEQHELIAALTQRWRDNGLDEQRLTRFHEAVKVGGRNLALPIDRYFELDGFGQRNEEFVRVGTDLGEVAVRKALDRAGLSASDVDAIFFTTVTGISAPTIDVVLANRLRMRSDIRRTPMFGLGCVGGAAGIARMNDYLRAHPDHVAVMLAVEICSVTLQLDDLSPENLIATGLFGDGAAAVVGVGAHRAGSLELARPPAAIESTHSTLFADTEDVMGWQIRDRGMKVLLSKRLPDVIREELRSDVDDFLERFELTRHDMKAWICHPGGPAVLRAVRDALALPEEALLRSWESLYQVGNLSSASVLFVLHTILEEVAFEPGDHALLMAMGPGFCTEKVLLRW